MMALRTRAKETVQVEFREVNATGVFLAHTEANQKTSMSLLQQNGFRALTYQEALIKLDQNPELKEQLKGTWFYLDGKGSALSGFYTFNDKGELTQGKGDIEKTVYVWKGSQSLSLDVLTDDDARDSGRRFDLNANDDSQDAARVVVGVRIAHGVGAPKIETTPSTVTAQSTKVNAELVDNFRSAIAKVEGVVTSEITDVFKSILRAIE